MAGLNVLCNLLLILVLSVLLFERHAVQFSSSVMSGSLQLHGLQQAKLSSITNTWSLFELMYIESVMPSNHLILCRSLLPLSTFPSIRDFSSESALRIRWPKYWSFSFSISQSNDYSELISFTMDWLDLLAVQGTLNSLFKHHSSKTSVLWCSTFFMIQLSHPYMTTRKNRALTRHIFVGKVISLFFNMLSRLVITFPSRSKSLLISLTICSGFRAPQNKVCHCFHCFPI